MQIFRAGIVIGIIWSMVLVSHIAVPASEPEGMNPPLVSMPMSLDESREVRGRGWLSCGAAIGSGVLLGGTLAGAVVGALVVACGCDDELDRMFGTRFRQACS
ncbi:MAG TPA: hypothetical protein PLM33_10060 [Acidobacteriota bacterium]|nr:hypothetical protein [Acidobacteriota bacterium]HRR25124.1 hypothetical protein [Acidobacteriota bacterium]HRV09360.1 hypothetical protein [Acidobacteriota bacterium]